VESCRLLSCALARFENRSAKLWRKESRPALQLAVASVLLSGSYARACRSLQWHLAQRLRANCRNALRLSDDRSGIRATMQSRGVCEESERRPLLQGRPL